MPKFDWLLCTMRRLFTIIVLLVSFCSCGQKGVHKVVNDASVLLSERPDSSLALLRSICIDDIHCNKDKARYALLKSAAYDKNYLDISSDSLISIALNYYMGHKGCDKQLMGAYYYSGIVYKNSGDYERAVVSFEKAENIAEAIEDYYHIGLINRNKADIFNGRNNIKEAIELEKKAITSFEKANAPLYLLYAQLSLAVLYNNDKDYESSASLLDSIEHCNADPYFINKCRLLRAEGMIAENNNLKKAIDTYLSVPEEYYHFSDYGRLAIAYERIGQKDSSDMMMGKAYQNARNNLDSASIDFMKARVSVSREDYKTAHDLVFHAALVQDSLTRVLLSQSLNNAQRDYYRQDAQMQELRAEHEHRNGVLTIIIIVLLFSLIIVILIGRNREKKEVIKEQMAQISMQGKELLEAIKANAFLVSSVFCDKYFNLERIATVYYNCSNDKEKEHLLDEFKKQADGIKNDKNFFPDLEKLLNINCNNIMVKIREQIPQIKGTNIRILALLYAGMPYVFIQILIRSQSTNALKTAKNRLKKTILESDAKDKELFLSLLNINKMIKASHK